MNGYRRGLSGPSLGHDADKDLLALVWIVLAIVVVLSVLSLVFPQPGAASGAPHKPATASFDR